jgi:choline dehydrogenase-like flavoprotein
VTVLLHATVADLLLDASRTAVVELPLVTGAGTELRLVARHTVLACGGIGNAQMLLNADSQMPGGLGNAHDQVGRYFSDHPILIGYAGLMTTRPEAAAAFASADAIDGSRRYRLALQPSQALRRERGLLNTLITLEGTDMLFDGRGFAGWSEGFIGPKAAAEAVARVQGREVLSVHPLNAGLETRPGPESRVLLTGERDAAGLRRVKLDWRLRQADLDLWLATMDVVAGEALAGGWGIVWVDPRAKDRFPKDIAWGHHHIGTTRMGADPKSSVCDADARVHGVSNLWVAGSSLFTSPGACNPTLNLVALALRLAKTLEARA